MKLKYHKINHGHYVHNDFIHEIDSGQGIVG